MGTKSAFYMMKKMKLQIIAVFLYFIFTIWSVQNASAQSTQRSPQPLQEVFQTELVYPQEKGETQLTFAPRLSLRRGRRTSESPFRVEYGITNCWQVEAEWNVYQRLRPESGAQTASGTGDVQISTKYSFMNVKNSNFHAAVAFEVGFPAGNINEDLSDGFIEYEPSLMAAKDFPQLNNLQIFSQIGVGLVQRVKKSNEVADLEPAAHNFKLNAGFFAPYKQTRFVGEVNWNTNKWNNGGNLNEVYLTPGFVYQPFDKMEFGLGTPLGITRDADKFRIILQAIFEF